MDKASDSDTIRMLADIEAIKKLKHRYLRCLDTKRWDEIKQCLAADVEASFMGGAMQFHGRDELMKFYVDALPATRITAHMGHHPEIEVSGEDSASGTWAVQTYLIDSDFNISLNGVSIFNEQYAREEGGWKIKSMYCYRTFEEMSSRGDMESLKLTQVMDYGEHDK